MSGTRIRSRSWTNTFTGSVFDPVVPGMVPWSRSHTSTERCVDESHGRGPHRGGDKGGPLFLQRTEFSSFVTPRVDTGAYSGPLVPGFQIDFSDSGQYTKTPDGQMDAWGTSAIARVAPENPAFNMAGFLGELMQGIPKIVGHTLMELTGFFKKLGDEYLNVVFGWLPFVNDVQKISTTVGQSEEIIRRYVTNSGEVIRRRFSFPPVTTTTVVSGTGYIGNPAHNIAADCWTTVVETDERWFSGAFRYYIPVSSRQLDVLSGHRSASEAVLRFDLTPDVLWQLTPWSWAIDWFTNVGDVMKNVTAMGVDGLVMQYGYVMRRRTKEIWLTQRTNAGSGLGIPPGLTCSRKITYVTLERRKATPYGFGLDESFFSPKRLAILAALGLSKGTR